VTADLLQPAWGEAQGEEALKAALSQQIGQLKVELDWLNKTAGHAC
jgi:hypothetical protein